MTIRQLFDRFRTLLEQLNRLLQQNGNKGQEGHQQTEPPSSGDESEPRGETQRLLDDTADDEVRAIYNELEALKKDLKNAAEEQEKPKAPAQRTKRKQGPRKDPEQITIDKKMAHVQDVFTSDKLKTKQYMVYMICYDITNNKLRKKIADYLEERGCQRVQKSVFMGEMHAKQSKKLHQTLLDIQEVFGEDDTIIMMPVSESNVQSMKMIGREVDMAFSLSRQNVLLF